MSTELLRTYKSGEWHCKVNHNPEGLTVEAVSVSRERFGRRWRSAVMDERSLISLGLPSGFAMSKHCSVMRESFRLGMADLTYSSDTTDTKLLSSLPLTLCMTVSTKVPAVRITLLPVRSDGDTKDDDEQSRILEMALELTRESEALRSALRLSEKKLSSLVLHNEEQKKKLERLPSSMPSTAVSLACFQSSKVERDSLRVWDVCSVECPISDVFVAVADAGVSLLCTQPGLFRVWGSVLVETRADFVKGSGVYSGFVHCLLLPGQDTPTSGAASSSSSSSSSLSSASSKSSSSVSASSSHSRGQRVCSNKTVVSAHAFVTVPFEFTRRLSKGDRIRIQAPFSRSRANDHWYYTVSLRRLG